MNYGCFKVPMLFGGMNMAFDKFGRIEEQYKKNLDNWLCNLYFEIDRIKLPDIKIHPDTHYLYYNFKKTNIKPISTPADTQRSKAITPFDMDFNNLDS